MSGCRFHLSRTIALGAAPVFQGSLRLWEGLANSSWSWTCTIRLELYCYGSKDGDVEINVRDSMTTSTLSSPADGDDVAGSMARSLTQMDEVTFLVFVVQFTAHLFHPESSKRVWVV